MASAQARHLPLLFARFPLAVARGEPAPPGEVDELLPASRFCLLSDTKPNGWLPNIIRSFCIFEPYQKHPNRIQPRTREPGALESYGYQLPDVALP